MGMIMSKSRSMSMSMKKPSLAISTTAKRTMMSSSGGSGSITYSGGQASEGQGGYYGSGGARKIDNGASSSVVDPRNQMLALAADVAKITSTMQEVETLEQLLFEEVSSLESSSSSSSTPSGKMIEVKSKLKKICTHPDLIEALNRLEINGEPIWGLSSDERDMIVNARNKVNDC